MIADCIVLYIAALNAVGWLSERAGVVATQQSQLEHSKSVKKMFLFHSRKPGCPLFFNTDFP